MADSAPQLARRQSVVAPQPIAMHPAAAAGAPLAACFRLAPRLALLLATTLLFTAAASTDSQQTDLYLVCKMSDFICEMWPYEIEDLIEISKDYYNADFYSQCGLSDLKPIPPHRKFIAVKLFNDEGTRLFCKIKLLRIHSVSRVNMLNDVSLPESVRVRRQAGYRIRGRYRGQTQSQYLSIDRGNGKDEGKAEAHSGADSSRAIVSGNSGMGQAQSQTIYDPSCEDCVRESDSDAANLALRPEQGYNTYSPKSTIYQKPGESFTPPRGSFDASKNKFPGGGQNQQAPSVGGNGYQNPDQMGGSFNQIPSRGSFNTFQQSTPGSNHNPNQIPPNMQINPAGNTLIPGQTPPSQLSGGSYTYPPNSNFNDQQRGLPHGNQNPPGLYNQQPPSGSYTFTGPNRPAEGNFFPSQQGVGNRGTGQTPFDNQGPNLPNRLYNQPVNSMTGQMVPPNQTGRGQYDTSQPNVPGGSFATSQQIIPSNSQPDLPNNYYNQQRNTIPGGQSLQTPGNFYQQRPIDSANQASRTNIPSIDTINRSGMPDNTHKIGTQGIFNPNPTLGQNGITYQTGQGTPIFTGQGNVNWPLLSSLLPAAGPGSTYFCCVVSPGSNTQTGNIPSQNAPFGGSSGQNGYQPPQTYTQVPIALESYGTQGSGQQNSQLPNGMQGGGNLGQNNFQTPNGVYGGGNIGQNNLQTPNGGQSGNRMGPNNLPSSIQGTGNMSPNNLQSLGGIQGGGNIPPNNLQHGGGTTNLPSTYAPSMGGITGQNNLQPNGLQGGGNMGQNNLQPPTFQGGIGQNSLQPSGMQGSGNIGQNNLLTPYGQNGVGNTGQSNLPSPYETQRVGNVGQNTLQPGGGVGQNNYQLPYEQGRGNVGQNNLLPSGLQGGGNQGQNTLQPNGLQNGRNIGQNLQPSGTQGGGNIGSNNFPPTFGQQNGGTTIGQQPNGLQGGGNMGQFPYGQPGGANTGQNLQPNSLQGGRNLGPSNIQSPYGQQGIASTGQNNIQPNGVQGVGTLGQNNLQFPYGQNGGDKSGINNQQLGSGITSSQGGYPPVLNEYGVPQNVVDPNAVSSLDDYDSEAQASVSQAHNGTSALASSKGGNAKGRAQTQVEGTYSGTGSFSANAEISDDSKAAQSHVSGSKKGASSSAEGRGRKNKSQASVKLGSETGSILTDSQSSGDMHSSSSQVQGGIKGGMADAQAKGPGSTSSQAQIGFTPFKEEDKKIHDQLKTPFEGGGTASAQSSGRMGTSQSQLRGTFKYGISYNGAAQAGSSLDKDAVFSNLLPFDKIDVFDENNKNINVDHLTSENPKEVEDEYVAASEQNQTEYTTEIDHSHSDHHKTNNNYNTTTRPPPGGNRRSFGSNYGNNGEDYDYPTDKETPPEEYDIDDGFGSDNDQVEQTEYNTYDDLTRETEKTHQSYLGPNKKGLEVTQSTGGSTQHIILGSLNKHDAEIIQKNTELPDESKIYQPGERVPGGYTIPAGFTGSVKSVASKDKTYVIGSKSSPSQAQTVTLTPGSGKVKYVNNPSYYRMNVNPKDMRSLHDSKVDDHNRYVSVSKSVTRDLDSENNIRKQYSHTYYTKSSSCGYFTFTCTIVSSAEGKKKVCRPQIPTRC